VWEIGQQIWDAIKMASALQCGDSDGTYLVAIAPLIAFDRWAGCELYETEPVEHGVAALIERNAVQWRRDLLGGPGRPRRVPATFFTRLVAGASAWYGQEARLIHLSLPEQTGDQLFEEDGWPIGLDVAAALDADAASRKQRSAFDANGLEIPVRISAGWWAEQGPEPVTREQYEALYGLLLTRNYDDAKIRHNFPPPPGRGPSWWK
jgi:hypothetical protein